MARAETWSDRQRRQKHRSACRQPMTFVAPTGLTLSFIGALSAWTIKSGVPFAGLRCAISASRGAAVHAIDATRVHQTRSWVVFFFRF